MASPPPNRPPSQRRKFRQQQQQPNWRDGSGGQWCGPDQGRSPPYSFYPPVFPPVGPPRYPPPRQGRFPPSGWGSRGQAWFPARDQPGGGPRQGGGAGQANYSGRRQGGGQNCPPSVRAQSPPPGFAAAAPKSSKQQQPGAKQTPDKRGQLLPPSPLPRPDVQVEPEESEGVEPGGLSVASVTPRGEEEDSREGVERDEAEVGSDTASPSSSDQEKMKVPCGVTGCTKTFAMSMLHEFSLQSDVGQWIKGQDKKSLRKEHLTRLFKFVNACLNTEGGLVYLHASTEMLHFLDEQLDIILMKMVPDGSLFNDNYERWINDEHHMTIRVIPRDRPMSTMDFKTMASTDKGLMELTHVHMRHLIRKLFPLQQQQQQEQQQQQQQAQAIGGRVEPTTNVYDCSFDPSQLEKGELVPFFHESTRTETKSVCGITTERDGKSLINYAWTSLKLANRITTFSKEEGGGSYFLGIGEKQTDPVPKWTRVEKFQEVDLDGRKVWDDTSSEKKVKEKKKILFLARPDQVPTSQDRTGGFVCEGVFLPEKHHESLKKHLHKKLVEDAPKSNGAEGGSAEATTAAETEMMWYPRITNAEDQVQVLFHPVKAPVSGGNEGNGAAAAAGGQDQCQGQPEAGDVSAGSGFVQDYYVIEIVVKNFGGLCFTDPLGPEAYEFKHPNVPDDKAIRITWEDWLRRQRKDLCEFAL